MTNIYNKCLRNKVVRRPEHNWCLQRTSTEGHTVFLLSHTGLFDYWINSLKLYLWQSEKRKQDTRAIIRLSSVLPGVAIPRHADTPRTRRATHWGVKEREGGSTASSLCQAEHWNARKLWKWLTPHTWLLSRIAGQREILKHRASLTGTKD